MSIQTYYHSQPSELGARWNVKRVYSYVKWIEFMGTFEKFGKKLQPAIAIQDLHTIYVNANGSTNLLPSWSDSIVTFGVAGEQRFVEHPTYWLYVWDAGIVERTLGLLLFVQ